MDSLLQSVLAYGLVALALIYTGIRVYRRWFRKKPSSPCDGCSGCALKEGLREKNCPKDLFPPK